MIDRFMAKVEPEPNSGCWLWTGGTTKGYGMIGGPGGRKAPVLRANRAAWMLLRGPIPDGMWVLHRCDVPACVNPDHLFLGTPKDNMQDASRKGRMNGERCIHSKLTDREVVAIRRERAAGEKLETLSRRYGIDASHISVIARRKAWVHVGL